jgi:hypothetical protein
VAWSEGEGWVGKVEVAWTKEGAGWVGGAEVAWAKEGGEGRGSRSQCSSNLLILTGPWSERKHT